jgi:hypothetical protein
MADPNLSGFNERRRSRVTFPHSYIGHPDFDSRSKDRLPLLRSFAILSAPHKNDTRRCSIDIVTTILNREQGFDFWQMGRFSTSPSCPDRILGLFISHTQLIPLDISVRIKRPVRETVQLPLSTAEVKNARSYTTSPLYGFMAIGLN